MADFDVTDLASVGLVLDIPGYQLPPEAFTTLTNVRVMKDGIARMPGFAERFGDVRTDNALWAMQVQTPGGELWWLYASTDAIYVLDGASESDISGLSAPYSADYWQGTLLGGVPIINCGRKKPQAWTSYNTAAVVVDLPNWPATELCNVIRAFGPNLVALNYSVGGTRYQHGVHWSHPADPGSVPISWDETDPTLDAGKVDLADTEAGQILNGLPLRQNMIIYKNYSTWLMRRIGGQYVFQFDQFLTTSGLLGQNTVALTGDGKYHFCVTNDDVILHDGTQVQSVIDKRNRTSLFANIDTDNFNNAFVFSNPAEREMVICYPSSGSEFPDRAMIWNYGAGGSLGVWYEADYALRFAALGDMSILGSETWATITDTWDTVYGHWASQDKRRVLATNGTKLLLLDDTLQRDGVDYTTTIARFALAMDDRNLQKIGIAGARRSGEPLNNWKARKLVTRVWPKIDGGPVNVRIGSQLVPNGAITWTNAVSFDPSTQRFVDLIVNGMAISIEFSTTTAVDWKLYGYTVEVASAGRF